MRYGALDIDDAAEKNRKTIPDSGPASLDAFQ